MSGTTDLAGLDVEDPDLYEYGERSEPAWLTATHVDAERIVTPRRPETLSDSNRAALFHDLESWTAWLLSTFRVGRWIPNCWPQHPALVEELMALWLAWQPAWQSADDNHQPAIWLHTLDASLSRIDRLWKAPCKPGDHKEPSDVDASSVGTPALHRWWGNPNYQEE